jgi:hypothetical protein
MWRREPRLVGLVDNARVIRGYIDGITRERRMQEACFVMRYTYQMLLPCETTGALPDNLMHLHLEVAWRKSRAFCSFAVSFGEPARQECSRSSA